MAKTFIFVYEQKFHSNVTYVFEVCIKLSNEIFLYIYMI